MTKAKFIRLSGWALMLASIVMVGGFAIGGGQTNWDDPLGGAEALLEYTQLLLIPSSLILYTVGMIGLRIRYGGPSSWLGNTSLLVAAIGGVVGVLGAILEFAFIEPAAWLGSWGWMNLMFSGMGVMLVGYSLFGVSAIRTRPLPRWNALPLLTAIWFPLVFIIRTIIELTGGDTAGSENYLAFVAMLFLLVGSIALGYILQNDIPAESQGVLGTA